MTYYYTRLPAIAVIAVCALLLGSAQLTLANSKANSAVTLRQLAAKRGIHVGSAVNGAALSTDATYAQILGQQFSSITPEHEMTWASVEPQQGVLDFAPADAEVQFAQQNHQLVRGHTLVWHNQLPSWLTSGTFTNTQIKDLLKQHIFTEAGHFRGEIWQWDVVNEPFNEDGTLRSTIWSNAIGPNYIADALKWTHQIDPHARLFLNDFNIEGLGPKSDAMYALVESLKAQHVPIDGVGFETHLDLRFPFPNGLEENLARFAALGLQVAITELDVRMVLPVTPDLLTAQANTYAQVMQACLVIRTCVDFTVWEYTDKYSWVPGFFTGEGAADIYDENFNPKPAYTALISTLQSATPVQMHG